MIGYPPDNRGPLWRHVHFGLLFAYQRLLSLLHRLEDRTQTGFIHVNAQRQIDLVGVGVSAAALPIENGVRREHRKRIKHGEYSRPWDQAERESMRDEPRAPQALLCFAHFVSRTIPMPKNIQPPPLPTTQPCRSQETVLAGGRDRFRIPTSDQGLFRFDAAVASVFRT